MIDEHFVILGALLSLIGQLNYVVNMLKGQTKPNRVTWFLWALVPMIAFSAQIDEGVGLAALMTFMVGFGPIMIFIASFVNSKSVWKITRFDIGCGVLSIIGVIFWLITGDGLIAIAMAILADMFASLPTIVKAYKAPETESYTLQKLKLGSQAALSRCSSVPMNCLSLVS